MDELSIPQHEILKLVAKYIEQHGGPPYRQNKWFVEQTTYTGNYVTNVKGELRKSGYLDSRSNLTDKGKHYVRYHFGPFTVRETIIRVQGTAQAGPSNNTFVQLGNLDYPSEEVISVPNLKKTTEVFAVRVNGESMTALGIMPGDYALVECQHSGWWPNPQDIILTKYLPHDPLRSNEYEPSPSNDYVGPVIKVYLQRDGEKGCRLGWRTSNEENPFLISADDLQPIGKIIGIYRDYQQPYIPYLKFLEQD